MKKYRVNWKSLRNPKKVYHGSWSANKHLIQEWVSHGNIEWGDHILHWTGKNMQGHPGVLGLIILYSLFYLLAFGLNAYFN